MWRLAPYYELFIPTRCQLMPSIVLQNEVVLHQVFLNDYTTLVLRHWPKGNKI